MGLACLGVSCARCGSWIATSQDDPRGDKQQVMGKARIQEIGNGTPYATEIPAE